MKLLFLAILLVSFSQSIVLARFAGGSGTKEDPWKVSSVGQLWEVRNHLNKHFIQVGNFDASDIDDFEPIGDDYYPFTGTYDGDGYEISGLTLSYCPVCPDYSNVGLFGRVDGGRIANMRLTDVTSGGSHHIGGLVGYNAQGEIINCRVTGNISGNRNVGGLVGWNSGSVINSFAGGDVTGNESVGGLVGKNNRGKISNSYSSASVTGEDYAGGLVGDNDLNSKITTSYAIGKVTARLGVGGLVGYNDATIESSYWDRETTRQDDGIGQGDPDGATSLTTSQMTGISACEYMTGFDFDKIWLLTEKYPALYWENVEALDPNSSEKEEFPASFELRANYPNPFNPSTQIRYTVPYPTHVRLDVYNTAGQHIKTLVNESKNAGRYEVTFDATGLSSGIYLYRLNTLSFVQSRHMMLVK